MMVNATFNYISVISWRSSWFVEETTDLSQVTDNLYHIMFHRVHLAWLGFELTTLVMIGTDCIGNNLDLKMFEVMPLSLLLVTIGSVLPG
jgi:hypothetical protein